MGKFWAGLGVAFLDGAIATATAGAAGAATGVTIPMKALGAIALVGGVKGVIRFFQNPNTAVAVQELPADLPKA